MFWRENKNPRHFAYFDIPKPTLLSHSRLSLVFLSIRARFILYLYLYIMFMTVHHMTNVRRIINLQKTVAITAGCKKKKTIFSSENGRRYWPNLTPQWPTTTTVIYYIVRVRNLASKYGLRRRISASPTRLATFLAANIRDDARTHQNSRNYSKRYSNIILSSRL